ncbi:peptidoglycan-binding domain-containing protein [Massilia sp. METH4]|uniref:peptidoglycan-binding domain-containing protein n=1 Tax=Massilia sp. METH4 TaxID=3123041 RepID=UPI0030CC9C2F
MALQSQLFRGDLKLEAAAVSDPAHIVPGAAGEHVRKIQLALILLDGAAIDADGKYGPGTAAAVLAYKRKRSILNRAYQHQPDNIAGKMTIASLDREMFARESMPAAPVQILPVTPRPYMGRPVVRLGFKIDVDFPVFPSGNLPRMRLAPVTTEKIEIVNAISGRVRCMNVGASEAKVCLIFDPDEPGLVPASRLNPVPRGPLGEAYYADGGTVRVPASPFRIHLDAFHPGNAFVDATNGTSAATLAVEVRAPRIAAPSGFPPPTKTRPGSRFISAADSEPGFRRGSRADYGGRPVNPRNTGRKINLFGSQETPGFDDYTTDLHYSGFGARQSLVFRPWTEDSEVGTGIENGSVSDICIRDSPVLPVTIAAIRRIAAPGCRVTFAGSGEGGTKYIPILKSAFAGAAILEEFADAIVLELR